MGGLPLPVQRAWFQQTGISVVILHKALQRVRGRGFRWHDLVGGRLFVSGRCTMAAKELEAEPAAATQVFFLRVGALRLDRVDTVEALRCYGERPAV